MLTEADMVRIMAAKFRLAESIIEENVSNELLGALSGDDLFQEAGCDMQNSGAYFDDTFLEGRGG